MRASGVELCMVAAHLIVGRINQSQVLDLYIRGPSITAHTTSNRTKD